MSVPDVLDLPDVLILGGTGEARALAGALVADGVPVISSLAGRVAHPRLPVGAVRIGGFGGVDGLRDWLRSNHVQAVIDATHPFAATITTNAAAACAAERVPLLRLRRAPWTPAEDEYWQRVASVTEAATALTDADRVLLTTGRQDVSAFADITSAWFLIRVVDPPTGSLPPHHEILRSRGPYHYDAERDLLHDNHIDTLVTKNSGGTLTQAKLTAARTLGVRVIMVDRPTEPNDMTTVDNVDDAASWVKTIVNR